MALFLPIFFGMMLGDVGYGALLLAICLALRLKLRTGMMRDLLAVLALGSVWALRAREEREPDRAETRILSAAADQLG